MNGSSSYATANGLRLHYLRHGDGPRTIVIVPGITSPAITWGFVATELAADSSVLTIDIRGRGLSDKPASGFALTDYAADVAGVIDAAGLRRPIVLGHSMGARIAAALAVLHPGAAGPLLIVEPPLTGPGRPPYPTTLDSFREQLREAYSGTTADEVRRFYPRWSDDALALRARWLASCDERAVVESYENFGREDFFGYWRALDAPLRFIYGADSPVVTEAGAGEVAAANPAAEIVSIPRAGHMIPWENLDDFIAAVRDFADANASA